MNRQDWIAGYQDAYFARPYRDRVDGLAYASGRVEGEADRLAGKPCAHPLTPAQAKDIGRDERRRMTVDRRLVAQLRWSIHAEQEALRKCEEQARGIASACSQFGQFFADQSTEDFRECVTTDEISDLAQGIVGKLAGARQQLSESCHLANELEMEMCKLELAAVKLELVGAGAS